MNPSVEMGKLDEELFELHQQLKHAWPKKQKEGILRQIRELESILGIESKPYNSNEFDK